MKFSILIPAHNEEAFLGKCLKSIEEASKPYPNNVEVIVSLNRCTDKTREIALEHGCKIAEEEAKNIAKVRNAAARLATGEVVVTIDADSWMSPNMLQEIDRLLSTNKYIGGGVRIRPERISLGIILSGWLLIPLLLTTRVSVGLFWCRKQDFEAVGGFNESLASAEDIDFGMRLKRYGRRQKKRYGTVWKAAITTSCRKFDIFGDWYLFFNPRLVWAIFHGKDQDSADKFFYDARK